ncbi:hypothetical protein AM202_03885 [Actinobacillus minor 202]|uniref:Uncharacterized protein n=1 Tax=Actinobacillus minor 202 TaxID=591023 RepID=A0ABM9YVD4_9PAST|nr:hypothetical protein AM202_03885 [Actinobacillus minor 202]
MVFDIIFADASVASLGFYYLYIAMLSNEGIVHWLHDSGHYVYFFIVHLLIKDGCCIISACDAGLLIFTISLKNENIKINVKSQGGLLILIKFRVICSVFTGGIRQCYRLMKPENPTLT